MNTVHLKNIWALLNVPRLLPHLVYYGLGGNLRIKRDVEKAATHRNLTGPTLIKVLHLLTFDKYFRNVFYF